MSLSVLRLKASYLIICLLFECGLMGAQNATPVSGRVLHPIEELMRGRLHVFSHAGKFGYIDQRGKIVVPAKWKSLTVYDEAGLAVWRDVDGTSHVVDQSGMVVMGNFDDGVPLGRGRFAIRKGQKWKLLGVTEELSSGESFDDVGSLFSEGMLAVAVNGRWGFVDEHGKVAIRPAFESADQFSEGLASCRKGDLWGFINHDGTWVIAPQFLSPSRFREGLAPVELEGNTFSFIDRGGGRPISAVFTGVGAFSEGRAPARIGKGLWGYVDHKGQFVIAPQFKSCRSFREGLGMSLLPDGTAQFVNHEGRVTISVGQGYDVVTDFVEGRAWLWRADEGRCINKTGAVVWNSKSAD